jgi:hypothetical protein
MPMVGGSLRVLRILGYLSHRYVKINQAMMTAKRFENMISTLSSETVVSVVFLLATILYHGSPRFLFKFLDYTRLTNLVFSDGILK